MSILSPIFFTMAAGFMNGTYTLPTKYMRLWQEENIWLVFSVTTFLLMPWICLPIIDHDIVSLLFDLPKKLLLVLTLTGFLFGTGMILFTLSLRYVGIGIAFMLNICAGTIFATLVPILFLEPEKLLTWFGLMEITALIFFCSAIITSYFASCHKMGSAQKHDKKHTIRGVLIGIFSGMLTSTQSFAYAYVMLHLKSSGLHYADTTLMDIPWLVIFNAAFFPYFIYFLIRNIKNQSLSKIFSAQTMYYPLFCLAMGALCFGSVLLFSQAASLFGHMGTVIAWPMLMVFIVLTANFWSFVNGEWENANSLALRYVSMSLVALVMAVVVLAVAGSFNR